MKKQISMWFLQVQTWNKQPFPAAKGLLTAIWLKSSHFCSYTDSFLRKRFITIRLHFLCCEEQYMNEYTPMANPTLDVGIFQSNQICIELCCSKSRFWMDVAPSIKKLYTVAPSRSTINIIRYYKKHLVLSCLPLNC